ncbi:MAG: HTH domain-containing protein [Actinobacteria bacterium]|nr:HTH domain-containing protein [Actinomycetota bacterium]
MNSYDCRYMKLQVTKLDQIIAKEKTVTTIAKELGVSRQVIHKRLARYKRFGISGLIMKRKKRKENPHNKTSKEIETLVIQRAQEYWKDGVETLSDRIQAQYNITLCSTTIYRILKRNNVRYTKEYQHTKKRWKKQLYAHTVPGKELQMATRREKLFILL